MTLPFISSAPDLQNYLGTDLTDDELAVIAVDAACEVVRGEIRQQVNYLADDIVILNGTGTLALFLPQLPVIAVSDVTEVSSDGTETALTVDENYRLGASGILYRVGQYWTLGRANFLVTYDHGWGIDEDTIPTVPSDIRIVALELAASIYTAAKASTGTGGVIGAVQSETIGPEVYSYDRGSSATLTATGTGTLTETQRRVLDRYRLRSVV